MGLDATDVVKKELERAEGAGGREKHVNSAGIAPHALTGDASNDPNVGGRDHPNPTLQTLQKMILMTPAGGVAEKFLQRSMGPQRAKDPFAGVHALEKEFGLSWAGDARYQEILRKSMSLEKLDQVIQETGAFVTDHWVYTLVGIAARVWLASKVKDNRKLQRYDVALLAIPLPRHGAEWLGAVNRAVAADDPAAVEAALDEAQLNFARVLVNLVSVGIAALPRPAFAPNTTHPRPIKDITPSSAQVPALQAAQPGLIASQLPALARAGRSVQEWIQYWVNVLNGATPLVQLPTVAAVVGELEGLGGLSVFFQEDHSGSQAGGGAANVLSVDGAAPNAGARSGEDRVATVYRFLENVNTADLERAVTAIVEQQSSHAGSPERALLVRAQQLRAWLRQNPDSHSIPNVIVLDEYLESIKRAAERHAFPKPASDEYLISKQACNWLENQALSLPRSIIKDGRKIPNEAQQELLLVIQAIPRQGLRKAAVIFNKMVYGQPFSDTSFERKVDMAFVTDFKNQLDSVLREKFGFERLNERVDELRDPVPMPSVQTLQNKPHLYQADGTDDERTRWLEAQIELLPPVPNGLRQKLSLLTTELGKSVAAQKKRAALADIYYEILAEQRPLTDGDFDTIVARFEQYRANHARYWDSTSIDKFVNTESALSKINQRRFFNPLHCGPAVASVFLELMGRPRSQQDIARWLELQTKQLPERHEGPGEPSLVKDLAAEWKGGRLEFPPLSGVYPEDMVRVLRRDGFDPVIATPSEFDRDPRRDWLALLLENVSPKNPVILVVGSRGNRHFVLATEWNRDSGRVTYLDPQLPGIPGYTHDISTDIAATRKGNFVEQPFMALELTTHLAIVPRAKADGDAARIGGYDGPLPRARGLAGYSFPDIPAGADPREVAFAWMEDLFLNLPQRVIRPTTGEFIANELRTKYLNVIYNLPQGDKRVAAEIVWKRIRQTEAETLEEALDPKFLKRFADALERRIPGFQNPNKSPAPSEVARKVEPGENLRKLSIDEKAIWAPLSDADLKLMREFIKRYRKSPDMHFPLSSRDISRYYNGEGDSVSRRIDLLNAKLKKGSLKADGSGPTVVIGEIEYNPDANTPSKIVRKHAKETHLKTKHIMGSNGGFWRFKLDSGFSLLSQKEPPTPEQNPGGD